MKIEFKSTTLDQAIEELMKLYGLRKRDLVTYVLKHGKYLTNSPVISEDTTNAINVLVQNGIIPVAVAEAISNEIDAIKNREEETKNSTVENTK